MSPSAHQRRKVLRRPLSKRIELGVGTFLFVCVFFISLLLLLFLSHSNRVATKGYDLKVLQSERKELMRSNEVLSMQIADLQSLDALERDSVIKSMVKVGRPKYIRADTAVAVRESESPES
jgi:hypothetical protein